MSRPIRLMLIGDSIGQANIKMTAMSETDCHDPNPVKQGIRAALEPRGVAFKWVAGAGRTTVYDDVIPEIHSESNYFNGKTMLMQHLTADFGPDFIVLQLGTNDWRKPREYSAETIWSNIRTLVHVCNRECGTARPIVVSPPLIDMSEDNSCEFLRSFHGGCEYVPVQLDAYVYHYASADGALYVDGTALGKPRSGDGIHPDWQQYYDLGHAIGTVVKDHETARHSQE